MESDVMDEPRLIDVVLEITAERELDLEQTLREICRVLETILTTEQSHQLIDALEAETTSS
jgi:hypothetical protein